MFLVGFDEEAKQAFLDTISEYNEMYEDQHDALFGRNPKAMIPLDTLPYYFETGEVPSGNTGMAALSGLMTNGNMNVLRA